MLACRVTGTEPSFLLHPLDVIGGDQVPELDFFPGMDVPSERKTALARARCCGRSASTTNSYRWESTRGASARAVPCPCARSPEPVMCGVVGIIELAGGTPDRLALGRMSAALVHRGPDDSGLVVDGPVGLAHRRLSIIDLATGQQPMSADGATVVFNGEIYNYLELRDRTAAARACVPHDVRH